MKKKVQEVIQWKCKHEINMSNAQTKENAHQTKKNIHFYPKDFQKQTFQILRVGDTEGK